MPKTPSDLLKEGIEEANWIKICTAYEILSGTELLPPTRPTITIDVENVPDTLRACATILSGTKPKSKQKTKTNVQVNKNKNSGMSFITDNDYTKQEEEEIIKNAIRYGIIDGNTSEYGTEELQDLEKQMNDLKKKKISKQSRKSVKSSWKVKCSLCEKEFTSNDRPDSVFGQKCSKCIKSMIHN